MRLHFLSGLALAAVAVSALAPKSAADDGQRITGPYIHANLAVYFIHGRSAEGPVPLSLAEALAKGGVKVSETGDVNELRIENTGAEAVFIQSGEIVKGGQQDRVITSSLVLPPKSGEVPLAAFCVEHGRWQRRGSEDVAHFASSAEAVPSREAKLAMRAPRVNTASLPAGIRSERDETYSRQTDVWASVSKLQEKLSSGLSAAVAAPESATSLQLSLENDKLREERAAYIKALQDEGQTGNDIIGYAFAINGRLNSADIYASNGLFQKMWPKQLQSAATEAIGETDGKSEPAPAPAADAVKAFLAEAKGGTVKEKALQSQNEFEVRDSAKAVYFASAPANGAVVHENYLAK